ncbi:DUF362 domain-containing protein [Candidatus Omnitrophota bacterium]
MKPFLLLCTKIWRRKISRKQFLKIVWMFIVGVIVSSFRLRTLFAQPAITTGRVKKKITGEYDLVEVRSSDAYGATIKAIESIGGIGRFVKPGNTVVIKPNIAWDRTPEYAANTNPQVVAALVELCKDAGAKRINVFDITCNDSRRSYASSGIEKVAKERGARVFIPDDWNMVNAHFEYNSPMEKWPILRDAVECDVFINVPVLKHHRLTGLTLSMKNLMGVCGGTRGRMHFDIGRKIVDLTDLIKPELTVIDATKVLVRNGPTGGDLNDVKVMDKVLVGTDPTLVDSYASVLMGKDPLSIPYIKNAVERNIGSSLVDQASILKLAI